MAISTIIFRTILIYFVVFFVMRIMGKREIGKLSVFDVVISIMIAEIAVLVLEDAKKPLIEGLLPMGILVMIQIIIAYLALKSKKVRQWFDGAPSIIIDNGKLNRDEMKKQRYNLDDLLLQLREKNIKDVADVEFAVLETTGKLSVFPRNEPQSKHAKAQIRYEGLPLPLIMDGKVDDTNLQQIGKTRFWLKNQIQSHGAADFKEVFLCTINYKGELFIDRIRRK